ncbi:MAG: hypothetical protein CFE32_05600 [Alphaproteobacteria bacterium PA3]|nr:MAG: hypothetical protein CFE32_05600 [Alphaproteobacteria bacterium PA3]
MSHANLTTAPTSAPDHASDASMAVIIDHAGARILPVHRDAEADTAAPLHLPHQTDRSQHDADRSETYPADTRFFQSIAMAVAGVGRLVVIGHGKGQSNEADHLMTYLGAHHPAVHARVATVLTADLPHASLPQLLALARAALHPPLHIV